MTSAMTTFRVSRGFTALVLTLGLIGRTSAQTPSTEVQFLTRIAQQPQQVGNYLDLAKLYDEQRRYQDEVAMLTRAMAIVRSEQGAIPFGRPVTPSDERPLRVGGGVMEPKRLKVVQPAYPEIARTAGVSGVVILELTVGKDGSVKDATILRSVALLDQAALEAVRQWRYTPTLLNGEPTEVILTVTVTFGKDTPVLPTPDSASLPQTASIPSALGAPTSPVSSSLRP